MRNYKALKSASKVLVRKQDVNGIEVLQIVTKSYDSSTGESKDDIVKPCSLKEVNHEINRCKSQISRLGSEQAELEELEKDLKAL